jgi:O-antigen biosynthesis protein
MTKSALLAVSRFRDLAGSEITALEYAMELQAQGWQVTLASFELGESLTRPARDAGIKVVELEPEIVLATDWDLIWVIHATTYYFLFAHLALRAGWLVFTSLSHFEPMECPPLELHPVDIFTVNSEEHKRFFCEQYPQYKHQVLTLPNAAPRAFFEAVRQAPLKLRRVAVVSNHPPAEVLEVMKDLVERGIEVQWFGVGGKVERVVPALLAGFDAVISIGKTVQYSLAMGLPVFCYDHFGGPGWITPDNIAVAADYNFSGRGCAGRRTTQELLAAVLEGPGFGAAALVALQTFCSQHFSLSRNVATVLEAAAAHVPKRRKAASFNVTETRILARYNRIPIRARKLEIELRSALAVTTERTADIERNANAQIAYRDALVADLQIRLADVEKNAEAQIRYRDALVADLQAKLDDVEKNASAQIKYRDALVAELEAKARGVTASAAAQTGNHDDLIVQLQSRLDDVQANAAAQIQYRDALVRELQAKLNAVEENASAQIHYRDSLTAELQAKLDAVEANANAQIHYRDDLVAELQAKLTAVDENANAQIGYRDDLITKLQTSLSAIKDHFNESLSHRESVIEGLRAELELARARAIERIKALEERLGELSERLK